MSNFYAQLNGSNVVIGISELAAPSVNPSLVSIESFDTALIGKVWNGTAFVDGPAPGNRTRLTRLEFRNQLTDAEKVAIYTAAESSVSIKIMLDDLGAAEYVELTDARTIAALNALETATLIGEGRAAEILAGIP
jgi:hypothetical protein